MDGHARRVETAPQGRCRHIDRLQGRHTVDRNRQKSPHAVCGPVIGLEDLGLDPCLQQRHRRHRSTDSAADNQSFHGGLDIM
jgi:hypothetical protein